MVLYIFLVLQLLFTFCTTQAYSDKIATLSQKFY